MKTESKFNNRRPIAPSLKISILTSAPTEGSYVFVAVREL